MEKQKTIKYAVLMILGISVLAGIIKKIVEGRTPYPQGATYEYMIVADTKGIQTPGNIKSVDIYMDFSGSMRGYIDFAGFQDCTAKMIPVVCDAMTKFDEKYIIESHAHCGNKVFNQSRCTSALRDKSIFNQNVTLLDNMIESNSQNVNDSSIVVVVSDMILSYGKRELLDKRDTFYNKTQLTGLGSKILNIATKLRTKNMHIAILQYMSDYNGKYYCNYTENLKPVSYKNEVLRNRPFYVMIIGTETNVKDVLSKDIWTVSQKPEHVFSTITFDLARHPKACSYESTSKDWTFIEGEDEKSDIMYYSLQGQDLANEKSNLKIKYNPHETTIPCYLDSKLIVKFDSSIFADADFVEETGNLKMTLQSYNTLRDENVTLIELVSANDWVETSNTNDDVNISVSGMAGKTWGLQTLIENISKAYQLEKDIPIARINLVLTK